MGLQHPRDAGALRCADIVEEFFKVSITERIITERIAHRRVWRTPKMATIDPSYKLAAVLYVTAVALETTSLRLAFVVRINTGKPN